MEIVPDQGALAEDRKSLFFNATSQAALLVVNKKGRREASAMHFSCAHDALTWCLANRCTLVVTPGSDPRSN